MYVAGHVGKMNTLKFNFLSTIHPLAHVDLVTSYSYIVNHPCVLCSDLYWSPKSGSVIYQMRMDDLSEDSNPRISIFWQDPSTNWTVVGIAMNYTTYGGYDYIYWAVSDQK